MSRHHLPVAFAAWLVAGCAGLQSRPPVEMLDERTGLTVAALPAPLELAPRGVLTSGRRPSFAYLGPVDWNRMGTHTQALWVHLAPGQDQALADITAAGALVLMLDDGTLALHLTQAPPLAREPYRPAAPWGQAAYFGVTVPDLRRLAASSRLALHCRAADGSPLAFEATADTRPVLRGYLEARGLTGD